VHKNSNCNNQRNYLRVFLKFEKLVELKQVDMVLWIKQTNSSSIINFSKFYQSIKKISTIDRWTATKSRVKYASNSRMHTKTRLASTGQLFIFLRSSTNPAFLFAKMGYLSWWFLKQKAIVKFIFNKFYTSNNRTLSNVQKFNQISQKL